MKPARFGFLVQTGDGRQYMPWIHIKDLCNIYLKAISDPEMTGVYNAVSPQHVTGREFINTLALVMKRKVFPVPVPAIVLRAVLGEMSDVILKGSRASSDKIINAGYNFIFSNLQDALTNVINN
jgi:NAD dependent epimerase/dehydratase family enzyme